MYWLCPGWTQPATCWLVGMTSEPVTWTPISFTSVLPRQAVSASSSTAQPSALLVRCMTTSVLEKPAPRRRGSDDVFIPLTRLLLQDVEKDHGQFWVDVLM